jgi:hypothetical protein
MQEPSGHFTVLLESGHLLIYSRDLDLLKECRLIKRSARWLIWATFGARGINRKAGRVARVYDRVLDGVMAKCRLIQSIRASNALMGW